mmetsp:Transcript_100260/g.269273  ORF Transcript_100260/g.269273 Transcript_100260/m.269273 type:complete len:228 (+) Transcript_100260:739-1422(+)
MLAFFQVPVAILAQGSHLGPIPVHRAAWSVLLFGPSSEFPQAAQRDGCQQEHRGAVRRWHRAGGHGRGLEGVDQGSDLVRPHLLLHRGTRGRRGLGSHRGRRRDAHALAGLHRGDVRQVGRHHVRLRGGARRPAARAALEGLREERAVGHPKALQLGQQPPALQGLPLLVPPLPAEAQHHRGGSGRARRARAGGRHLLRRAQAGGRPRLGHYGLRRRGHQEARHLRL